MYGRLMLTIGVFVDGKCYHDHGIHTDPMGIEIFGNLQIILDLEKKIGISTIKG